MYVYSYTFLEIKENKRFSILARVYNFKLTLSILFQINKAFK